MPYTALAAYLTAILRTHRLAVGVGRITAVLCAVAMHCHVVMLTDTGRKVRRMLHTVRCGRPHRIDLLIQEDQHDHNGNASNIHRR